VPVNVRSIVEADEIENLVTSDSWVSVRCKVPVELSR